MAVDTTGWSGINSGVDDGDVVEAALNTAFSKTDLAIAQINTNITDIATNYSSILVLQNPEKTLYQDMTGNEPVHADGQVYFADGVLNVQDGYPDVTLQVGREMHMEVVNNTGVTITNGSACRHNGVTGGQIQVVLALADTFEHASILGIATHDIVDGATGLLTVFGLVRGIDTSGLPIGTPLYLSDTVAGTYTSTAPIVRTRIGGVKIQDATDGSLFVNIINNEILPRTLGSLLSATAPTSLPADLINGTAVSNYSDSIEIITQVNEVTGVITVQDDGIYRINISLHMFFDNVGGAGKKEIDLDIVDITGTPVTIKTIKGFILKDAETYDITDNGALTLVAGHNYRLEIRSEIALTNFEFSTSTFYIESILY